MNFVERISSFTAWATARCNLACKYCYVYKLYENQPKKTMDEESIRSMLEFAKRSPFRPFKIWWFGGEPLVAWKEVVVRAVEIASEMGLRVPEDVSFGFTTNATLLDEDKVKFMARYRMGVLLSIDGTKETHDKYRVYHDGRGSFDDVWRNINLVRKHLNPNPELRVTVHPSNFKHLTSIVEFFVENGLTALACDPVYECKYYEEDYEILRKELLKLRSKMIQWARRGAVPMLLMARKPVEVEKALSGQWTWTDRCGLGTGNVGVDVNGDVYPCHRFVSSHDKSISLGNVNESIDNEKIKRWVEGFRSVKPYSEDPSLCYECAYRIACNGGCIAVNWDLFRDVHVVPETYCRISMIALDVFTPFHLLMKYEGNESYRSAYLTAPQP